MKTSTLICVSLASLFVLAPLLCSGALRAAEAGSYTMPETPRRKFNMNPGWKFIKEDAKGAEAPGFDDRNWKNVSLPHTFNEEDTFDKWVTGEGDREMWKGIAWYRKHFKVPKQFEGGKMFLEVEGLRQAGHFYLNGKDLGYHENGVGPGGFDLTAAVKFGDEENVLAVQVDNRYPYWEKANKRGGKGEIFQWGGTVFNPNYGGLNRNAYLHVTGKVYQTLPLYSNLETSGVYVYASNFNIPGKTADVNVESEVKNESEQTAKIALEVHVVDAAGKDRLTFGSAPVEVPARQKAVIKAAGTLKDARFWDELQPNLYTVHTVLAQQGKPIDVCSIQTGFRKAEFRSGQMTGGIYINDRFVMMKGYAQRSTSEWAGLGAAYPNWMHDYTQRLIADSWGNHIRWMHVAPKKADVIAGDLAGIFEVLPAGDNEGEPKIQRQWEHRVDVMRDAMIYFRNNPSILMYEAGNNGVNPERMKEMHEIRLKWDPAGGRAMGCRTMKPESYPFAEYLGTMGRQGYTDEARDKMPVVETEYLRDEAARRYWDDFSPPSYGFKQKPNDMFNWNSETFCLANAKNYESFFTTDSVKYSKPKRGMAGYAAIMFTDSNSHGRQKDSEVCRVSGRLDAVRLPKQVYYLFRVMQSPEPDIHIIGHWTYPAGTKKTIYVASNCDEVELFLNGKSKGKSAKPDNRLIFAFPEIAWEPGKLRAVGYWRGKQVCEHELVTAGAPKRIKLTAMTGPGGLRADGSDVALFDVEVVDEKGQRCPTDEARVDFEVSGPCVWRGGYNSGKLKSTNNLFLDTECGINRVALRSTMEPGRIVVKARREGLEAGTAEITSAPVPIANGLSSVLPADLEPYFPKRKSAITLPQPWEAVDSAASGKPGSSSAQPAASIGAMPAPFAFKEVKNAALFSYITSEPIIVSGVSDSVLIRIDDNNEEAAYSIDGGPFQKEEGKVKNGAKVRVQLGSGSEKGASYYLKLNIGGRVGEFRVATQR